MQTSAHWLEESSPAASLDFYKDLAYSHACEGGAVGARILELLRKDDIRGLCEFDVNYDEFDLNPNGEGVPCLSSYLISAHRESVARQVYHCRQALAYFQKLPDLEIGIDKEESAKRKFLEAESLCSETNHIIRLARSGAFSFSPRVSGVLHAAQRKIARILGDVPTLGSLDLHFGPGATRATKRKVASTRRKLAERLQCSEELSPLVPYLLEELPHLTDVHSALDRVDEDGDEWSLLTVELQPSKLSFVPKNAKTLRSICTEPGLNTLVQLGLGSEMARRLAAFGIDIRDQTLNQRRAAEGSLTGALATLDLSSASDTISTELVFELLPLDWATLLNRCRTRRTLLPWGGELLQEKFSSMGNGFTFPLETLIFWSLAAACCENDRDATAYGDDLIVPVAAVELLMEVLTAVGFVVNKTKSYHTGPFRESCGKDYYWGIDVRPAYQKGWVTGQSLFVLHNYYWRRGDHVRAERIRKVIHPSLLVYGPDEYGDGHLLGEHPRRRPRKYLDRGFSGYFFDSFVASSEKDRVPLKRGEYVVPLYTVYRRHAGELLLSIEGLQSFELQKLRVTELRTSPLPLPLGDGEGKALPLPGVSGYKKISIYTLKD